MSSKAVELECLNYAIQYAKYQRGNSRKTLNLLQNEDFGRAIDERPDFVKCCPAHAKNEKGTLLGIEHFQVDHFSDKLKGNKVGGSTIKFHNDIFIAQQNWSNEVSSTEGITDNAAKEFAQLVARGLYNRYAATYNAFLFAFEFSLKKHLSKVEEYRNYLASISAGKFKIELGKY